MNKKISKSAKNEGISLESIAEDVSTLMDMNLTRQQAFSTLALFPNLDDAKRVAESYRSIPKEERPVSFTDYNDFLESLRTAIYGPAEVQSLYDQEVQQRTARIPEEKLAQESYKDRPSKSSHYWEHQVTRNLDA